LVSKENEPVVPTSAMAMPLLGMVPFTQPWTSGVISIRTNWFNVDVFNETGLFPVADGPKAGALL
jgi:hypothetical protein